MHIGTTVEDRFVPQGNYNHAMKPLDSFELHAVTSVNIAEYRTCTQSYIIATKR